MSKYEEYLICKERGHEADVYAGIFSDGSLAWETCKHCGTKYATRTTTELLEENAPTPDQEKSIDNERR